MHRLDGRLGMRLFTHLTVLERLVEGMLLLGTISICRLFGLFFLPFELLFQICDLLFSSLLLLFGLLFLLFSSLP